MEYIRLHVSMVQKLGFGLGKEFLEMGGLRKSLGHVSIAVLRGGRPPESWDFFLLGGSCRANRCFRLRVLRMASKLSTQPTVGVPAGLAGTRYEPEST